MIRLFIFDVTTILSTAITILVPVFLVHWNFVSKNIKASLLFSLYSILATTTVLFMLTYVDFFVTFLQGILLQEGAFEIINAPTIMYSLVIGAVVSLSVYLLGRVYKVNPIKQPKLYLYIGLGVVAMELISVIAGFPAQTLSIVGGGI